jgi:hypothetical protein
MSIAVCVAMDILLVNTLNNPFYGLFAGGGFCVVGDELAAIHCASVRFQPPPNAL